MTLAHIPPKCQKEMSMNKQDMLILCATIFGWVI